MNFAEELNQKLSHALQRSKFTVHLCMIDGASNEVFLMKRHLTLILSEMSSEGEINLQNGSFQVLPFLPVQEFYKSGFAGE